MRKSKFTESQIVTTLKQVEAGRQVKDVCRDVAGLGTFSLRPMRPDEIFFSVRHYGALLEGE